MRPKTLNCLICNKNIEYLYKDTEEYTNLSNAADVKIVGAYGSDFDTDEFDAVICDGCLENAVNLKRVNHCKSHFDQGF